MPRLFDNNNNNIIAQQHPLLLQPHSLPPNCPLMRIAAAITQDSHYLSATSSPLPSYKIIKTQSNQFEIRKPILIDHSNSFLFNASFYQLCFTLIIQENPIRLMRLNPQSATLVEFDYATLKLFLDEITIQRINRYVHRLIPIPIPNNMFNT